MAILNVSISDEALAFVRQKIATGEYASESEVINESIETLKDAAEEQARWDHELQTHEALQQESRQFDQWLHDEVGPTYDQMKADPSLGIPIVEVMQHLEDRRRARAARK